MNFARAEESEVGERIWTLTKLYMSRFMAYMRYYVLVILVVFYYVSLPLLLIEINNTNIKEKSSQNIPGINR